MPWRTLADWPVDLSMLRRWMRSHPLNQDSRAGAVVTSARGAVAGLRVEPGADKLSSSELL